MSEEFFRIHLDKPIKAHGEDVTEIALREPVLGDFKGIRTGGDDGFDLGQVAIVVSRLGSIPPSSAEQIPVGKLLPLKDKIAGFLP